MRRRDVAALGAIQAAGEIRARRLSCAEYARELLAVVEAREPEVLAWSFLDAARALEDARALDESIARGDCAGPLLGVPVGIKDIVDVRGMPTENGTVLHAGRIATDDAVLVARLRRTGAWPIGKTVTTELATYAPGKTRNPHDAAHTPGGSSSGSAAAVACGMVPLAIGTQTNGSMIRPASFCGVVGYKPSFGRIPRTGVLEQSPPLDQVGVFARTVDDAATLAEALFGPDAADPATVAAPVPPLAAIAASDPPSTPRLAWARTPWWDRVAPDAQRAFDRWVDAFGAGIERIELPEVAAQSVGWLRTVMEADIAASYEREYETGRARLSESLQRQIERGRAIAAVDYRKALAARKPLGAAIDALFERFDAIATPAALGTAPLAADGTGDPLMCTLWTVCGLPAISLPLLAGENGLPLGVQLVGRFGDDARLLRTARWLMGAGTIRA